jgi:flavin-dependent dehydrogenase
MVDAIVVGAGPAGSVAALVMARTGARVLIVDRATRPRDPLRGDLLNSDAVSYLHTLGLNPSDSLPNDVVTLRGSRVSVPGRRIRVVLAPPDVPPPLAIRRRSFDAWLLEAAIHAGARFEPGWRVRRPLIDDSTGLVRGVVMQRGESGRDVRLPALIVIGADGRRSLLARRAGLHVPSRIRQRAASAHVTGIDDVTDLGEMHIAVGAYCGVTPRGRGVVTLWVATHAPVPRDPAALIRQFVSGHRALGMRCGQLQFVDAPRASGVLASEPRAPGVPGLLLAGDAAGFVEPLACDGVHLAMIGGQLAAEEALRTIDVGDFDMAVSRLDETRRNRLGQRMRTARLRRNWGSVPVLARLVPSPGRLALQLMGYVTRESIR